jgi:hypothetical protein
MAFGSALVPSNYDTEYFKLGPIKDVRFLGAQQNEAAD